MCGVKELDADVVPDNDCGDDGWWFQSSWSDNRCCYFIEEDAIIDRRGDSMLLVKAGTPLKIDMSGQMLHAAKFYITRARSQLSWSCSNREGWKEAWDRAMEEVSKEEKHDDMKGLFEHPQPMPCSNCKSTSLVGELNLSASIILVECLNCGLTSTVDLDNWKELEAQGYEIVEEIIPGASRDLTMLRDAIEAALHCEDVEPWREILENALANVGNDEQTE